MLEKPQEGIKNEAEEESLFWESAGASLLCFWSPYVDLYIFTSAPVQDAPLLVGAPFIGNFHGHTNSQLHAKCFAMSLRCP